MTSKHTLIPVRHPENALQVSNSGLAQGVTGVVNRANAGVMPTPEETEHANKRFAELRDNWPELWAKEKAATAAGRDR